VIDLIILFINALAQLLVLLVIVSALLSFFVDPYHPVRRWIDSVVDPMLAPIRRILPSMGGLDLSPLVLIILLQLLARIIISLLATLR
jgi:YggT family protein